MKSIAIFGGNGGLGYKVTEKLRKHYSIFPLSSRDCDISNFLDCKDFFDHHKVDIVINLAGVNYDKMVHKINEEDDRHISTVLGINIHGAINIAAAALPQMRDRGYGRFIYTSSVLATKDIIGTSLYSSCKSFIDKFVKGVSVENIGKGITANSIQLGYFDGGLTYKLPDPNEYKDKIPLKRWGTIDELVGTIEYLINTEYITGQNIQIAGGV